MRVFPDTNVLFSALASRGLCADLLRALLTEHDIVVGILVEVELRRNLLRKLRMPPERVDLALAFLSDLEHAPPAPSHPSRTRKIDAADAGILACAESARAEVFVTGDRALLALGAHAGMPIVSPRELWTRLRQGTGRS